jgi:hypothetical protein
MGYGWLAMRYIALIAGIASLSYLKTESVIKN